MQNLFCEGLIGVQNLFCFKAIEIDNEPFFGNAPFEWNVDEDKLLSEARDEVCTPI